MPGAGLGVLVVLARKRNQNGKGLINNIRDLDAYTSQHGLDGFVVEGRAYLLKASGRYQGYLKQAGLLADRELPL